MIPKKRTMVFVKKEEEERTMALIYFIKRFARHSTSIFRSL